MALGLVRAAQGRDDEAEVLLRDAVDRAADATDWIRATTTGELARFLRTHGRRQEAAELEARVEPPVRVG
jgi:hypothetical protein